MSKKPLALPRGRTLLLEEVKQLTGFEKSAIYYRNKVGHKYYDATFPPRIQRGNSTAVGWDEQALLVWLDARPPAERRSSVKQSEGTEGSRSTKPRKVAKADLIAAMKAVLLETVQSCKFISHYKFVLAVRQQLERNDVDVQESLLDEIDRKAYAKHKVLPTLVIQERGRPVRAGWYSSALRIQVLGDSYEGHYEKLFLAALERTAQRPTAFSWMRIAGFGSSMKPLYGRKAPVPLRPPPDPTKVAAEEAHYAKLLPEGYVPGRGTNRGT